MKKYIVLLLVCIVVLLAFLYPADKRPDLNGNWQVEQIIINGKDILAAPDTLLHIGQFHSDMLAIKRNTFKLSFGHTKTVTGQITFPYKDTLVINSGSGGMFNSKYHISIDTLSNTTGYTEEFDYHVTLRSATNTIKIYRSEAATERNDMLNSINSKRKSRGTP